MINMMDKVIVVLEGNQKGLSSQSAEILKYCKGVFAAEHLTAIVLCQDEVNEEVFKTEIFNVAQIFYTNLFDGTYLNQVLTAIQSVVEALKCKTIIGVENDYTKQLLPQLAALNKGQILGNILTFIKQDNQLICKKEIQYGKVTAMYSVPKDKFAAITIAQLEKCTSEFKRHETLTPEVTHWQFEAQEGLSVDIQSVVEHKTQKDIMTSDVVLVIGRAFKNKEQIDKVYELAKLMNAAVGCTRPLVDQGLMDISSQIGQTGRSIAPKVYIGLGVSGATQHITGMMKSATVIAINEQQDAPIFKYANYGYVGDVFETVDLLMTYFKEREE
ncbi:electron transfer flavoprotein subunit alpha/FixB family protein [Cellulosilyticum ruminicola]|uniref:electron transfer flavoprotein subunit alpha/FixB family protein n=1 Tax=Cellulosilyticum ruminicola TaxID=425254 RepID=UPI0006D1296A|nr:electron transfer flavoprotein subunit alpha/FixB family protein [Cellulosilyticum ruminicola]